VWRRYDYMVRTSTVQGPGGDASVIRIRENNKALALAVDGNGRQVYLDPYMGGMLAVAEATRNISCCGAEPLGITDCLNFGNPEKAEIYWQFYNAVSGMAEACKILDTPVVGGNVSFYNEVEGEAIYPTPVVGAVGLLENYEDQGQIAFRHSGDLICLLGAEAVSLGGSQFLKTVHGLVKGPLAKIDLTLEKRLQQLVRKLISTVVIESAHDLADGGLAISLAECSIAGALGAVVRLPALERPETALFGEGPSRILVSINPINVETVKKEAAAAAVPLQELGQVRGESLCISCGDDLLVELDVKKVKQVYEEAFQWIMD
jgi:phosphoribosylformylglycinamidine synthase subunit PurL